MDAITIDVVVNFLRTTELNTLDLTGGAPELNPYFRNLVRQARALNLQVIDRCNLTILEEPGHEDLAEFLADAQVEITASLPCYSEENVDAQRGDGVFARSIAGLRQLNRLGYGKPDSGLILNLVYNPQGVNLPPPQKSLERDYYNHLEQEFNIVFNRLYTITNMPIKRFGSTLISNGQFHDYMNTLRNAHQQDNLAHVMCRSTLSVDWQGYVYDCDFNQMLNMPIKHQTQNKTHLSELMGTNLDGQPIHVANHCYGCTAGQGSSCAGALGT